MFAAHKSVEHLIPPSPTVVTVLAAEPRVEVAEQRRVASLVNTVEDGALPCLVGQHIVYRSVVHRTGPITMPCTLT